MLTLATMGDIFFLEWPYFTGNIIFKNVLSKDIEIFAQKVPFKKTQLSWPICLMRDDFDLAFTLLRLYACTTESAKC